MQKTNIKVGISLKHLYGSILCSIVNIPVIDAAGCDEAEGSFTNPLPELDIVIHCAGLQLLLLLQIENLQCS